MVKFVIKPNVEPTVTFTLKKDCRGTIDLVAECDGHTQYIVGFKQDGMLIRYKNIHDMPGIVVDENGQIMFGGD